MGLHRPRPLSAGSPREAPARVGGVAGIRGPGGNVVAAGRGAAFVNGQFVGGKAWTAVNGAYTRWGAFAPGWYGRYPGAWWPGKWAMAATAWAAWGWGTAGSYCGCSGEGAYYDYGGNVTYEDDTVYYGDQPVATAEQYYDQAEQTRRFRPDGPERGVAALGGVRRDYRTDADPDRQGHPTCRQQGRRHSRQSPRLRSPTRSFPSSARLTRRPSASPSRWKATKFVVMETGLYNLTNDEVPVLVHFSPDRQEGRTLIRLKQPEEQAQQSTAASL